MRNKTEVGFEANRSVLIVAKPGRIRDSLEALLRTVPQIKTVGKVDDTSKTFEMISECSPDLVLLFVNLPHEESWQILEHLRSDLQTKCLVLTDTRQQQEMAKANGADDVLIIGFKAVDLFEKISRLLAS